MVDRKNEDGKFIRPLAYVAMAVIIMISFSFFLLWRIDNPRAELIRISVIDKIVPNFVGGDIGCGIVSYPLDLERGIKPKSVDNFIKRDIALGSEIYSEPIENVEIYLERIEARSSGLI